MTGVFEVEPGEKDDCISIVAGRWSVENLAVAGVLQPEISGNLKGQM
jgi:hypothetical protein